LCGTLTLTLTVTVREGGDDGERKQGNVDLPITQIDARCIFQ